MADVWCHSNSLTAVPTCSEAHAIVQSCDDAWWSTLTTPLNPRHISLSLMLKTSIRLSSHSSTFTYLLCLFANTALKLFIASLPDISFSVVEGEVGWTYHSTCTLLTAHLYPIFFPFLPLLFTRTKARSATSLIVSIPCQ